jgi:cell division protein FtsN
MSMLVYLLAALAGVLLGVIGLMIHSKKKNSPLKENLVDGEVAPAGSDDNVWLAPVSN